MVVDDLLWRALLAGALCATIAGTLGCFVVWRRMAYFGDSLAHSALLGIALGLLLGISVNASTIIVCLGFSLLLVVLMRYRILATDTLLGILAHTSLSIGILALSFVEGAGRNLHGYLFGDIVAVSADDIWRIGGVGAVVVGVLVWKWPALVLTTLSGELARSERIHTTFVNLLLLSLVSLVVAVAIKIVGILLITALLIIPPASARLLAQSPVEMAVISGLFGVMASTAGVLLSAAYDLPTGPGIVICASVIFLLTALLACLRALRTAPAKISASLSGPPRRPDR